VSVKPYVFDTSSFVRAWHEAYPIDVVQTFWIRLHDAITDGVVLTPDEVLRETSKRSDELHKWLKEREDDCIVAIDDELEDAVTELLDKNPRMAMNRKGASSADAWVVALAKIRGATVISEETMTDSQKRPKIPGICKDNNLKCVNLLAFMRAQKWKI
jgi:predicted nucleic acid-binding protein